MLTPGLYESTRNEVEDTVVARKRKPMKKLTKRQQATLRRHASHHTKKHMQYMLNSMKRGATFTQAHKRAQKSVGK